MVQQGREKNIQSKIRCCYMADVAKQIEKQKNNANATIVFIDSKEELRYNRRKRDMR
ncbi:hypothetical protein CIRMBP1230_01076 [Enterococcus cecorum]|uniref:hypothetical protein n=1 Tax=Enterococcus cecorum TaxID=44008 RepID=UPI001F9B9F74|nr:hypothetical protein [Enterococcus cecorum]HJD16223.1 hypothetical protein [Candidatus Enterococcus stercoripullorum]CAI3298451.1 hypothetical protein CIRMBP1281_00656 [Enterococcus cecorum]CAI3300448.1 hypothetical protein CIRMBP1228_00648 [Enterococcus cecorum]CAI3312904.1 hypothetical protein CIRMBP1252_00806 [Enterococcus cecorum]CAI3322774.1 hypothetical protein CIRMBP1224_00887 [Enterococcus cecorum]